MEKIWLDKYPPGVPTSIDNTQFQSIRDLFESSCAKFGDSIAFTCMGATLSYEELDYFSKHMASFFQNELGLKKGDRVAIQMPNILQFPIALFGALRAGLVVVNTNPLYTEREMEHQFKDSGAKAIIIVANFAHHLDKIIKNTEIKNVVITELGDMLGFPKKHIVNNVVKHVKKMVPKYNLPGHFTFEKALAIGSKKSHQDIAIGHDDLAFLQYTGGTTGVSKGAMLTNKNIISNVLQIVAWMKPFLREKEEIVCTPLPLYHIFSLTVNCMTMMYYGANGVLVPNPRDIPGFIKLLSQQKFTVFTGLNTLFNGLMNHADFTKIDFSSLKLAVAGGMAMQTPVSERWEKLTGVRIAEGYGLTETSPVACVNPLDSTSRYGSIGIPVPDTDIKVVDENRNELPIGEAGELCIFGPQVMKGYWQKPEETNMVLKDGWLFTGDIAEIGKDGFVKIVDRKKDMILVSGFNVYPNEVEDVIAAMELVGEVAAVGVADEKSGEVVKVFIVPKSKDLRKEDIIAYCKENLAGYKVPRHIEFKEDLPKSNVGKVLRRELRNS